MAYEGKHFTHTIAGSADLSDQTLGTGGIYKPIALDDGDFAQDGNEAFGLITKGARALEHTTLAYLGVMKYIAGVAFTPGQLITFSASGYATLAASGDWVSGRNLENAVASGAVGTGVFNFAQPVPFYTQSSIPNEIEFTSVDCTLQTTTTLGSAIDIIDGTIALPVDANAVLLAVVASGQTGRGLAIGIANVRAGAVITAGAMITVDGTSGYWLDADSGDTVFGRAYAASAAGNCGNTFLASVNMATPFYATSCLDLLV